MTQNDRHHTPDPAATARASVSMAQASRRSLLRRGMTLGMAAPFAIPSLRTLADGAVALLCAE